MRLFIVSNRLPVKITCSSDGKFIFSRSEGGVATGLKSLDVDCEKHWIGWPGVCVEQKTEKDDICCQLEKNNYHPIFLSDELQSAKPPIHLFKTKRFYFEVLFQNEASLLEQNQTAFKWTSNPI